MRDPNGLTKKIRDCEQSSDERNANEHNQQIPVLLLSIRFVVCEVRRLTLAREEIEYNTSRNSHD